MYGWKSTRKLSHKFWTEKEISVLKRECIYSENKTKHQENQSILTILKKKNHDLQLTELVKLN